MMKFFLLSLRNWAKSGMLQSLYLTFNRELLPDKTQFLGLLEVLARADETVVREQVIIKYD
jgi:hypothetical protein